ncbi:MAG: DUF1385 domain-containing protein [Deltaproteobacteria bacterium]|nr:DUF1385 domain-containing protein [Deltaproteobacteria bacterium]
MFTRCPESKRSEDPIKVGGQAVMEGVMMRSPNSFAVAVRRASGEIVLRESPWRPLLAGWKMLRWPFIRGSLVLLESLVNGISALNFSARIAMADLEKQAADGEAAGGEAGAQAGALDLDAARKDSSDFAIWATVIFALGLGIGLFIALPHMAVWLGSLLAGRELTVEELSFHAIVGVVKLGVFIGYIALISLMKDVRRVFEFHGAEHQSIYTYEAGQPLTVEYARQHIPLHPRCGTTFLIMVILLSILVFALVFPLLIWLLGEPTGITWLDHVIYVLIKLPLLFPIAGLAYEFQRFTSKYLDRWWARALAWPGMFIQRLTTRPPSDDQLEIALTSLRKTLWRERVGAADGEAADGLNVFCDFDAVVEELGEAG